VRTAGLPSILVLLAACGAPRDDRAPGFRGETPTPRVLALAGDTMLARRMSDAIERRGAKAPFDDDVAGVVRGADLAFVDLECVIAEGGAPFQPPRVFYFRATPKAIDALRLAGIRGVNQANNHAMDYGPDALLEDLRRLDDAGIAHVGAGKDAEAAAAPVVLSAGDLKIGFVGFADHYADYAATPDRPGTNYLPTRDDDATVTRAKIAADAARKAGAQIVVFSWHHGPNMNPAPDATTVSLARRLIDEARVDVVHGHGAHCLQGVEVRGAGVILYDTGDFVDDYEVDPSVRNDQALLYLLTLDRTGLHQLDLVPLTVEDLRVRLATKAETADILKTLERRSAPFGTRFESVGARIRVVVR